MTTKTLHSIGASLVLSSIAHSATPVWFDSYDVTANTMNINADTATRQFGTLGTISYVANTTNPANDIHHQMFAGSSPLLMQGDGAAPAPAPTMVSPNYNFTGPSGGGILGKQVSFSLDVASFILNNAGGSYVSAGITVGSSSTLSSVGSATSGFGFNFVEDTFGGGGSFIEIYDGSTWLGNLANPAGFNPFIVDILINDFGDGNPWDGVGSTTAELKVNGASIVGVTRGSGGLINNYITLQGHRDFNGNDMAQHAFDGLTVFTDPIPEPSAALLGGLGLLGLLRRRRA
jgi:hypothetical protein